jgi:hypothetical protein
MNTIRTVHTVTGPTLTVEIPAEFKGRQVEVQVKVLPVSPAWGDGLRRCAGALADEWTDEDDRILAEIHQGRKSESCRVDDWLIP